MPVLVERVESAGLSKDEPVKTDFLAVVQPGAKNVAVLDNFPNGKEPICVVNCKKDNTEANLYIMKPYRYLPVFKSSGLVQVLVFDDNKDEFVWQRFGTLTVDSNVYNLPVKCNGEFAGSWIRFTLI